MIVEGCRLCTFVLVVWIVSQLPVVLLSSRLALLRHLLVEECMPCKPFGLLEVPGYSMPMKA